MKATDTALLLTVSLFASCQEHEVAASTKASPTPQHRREASAVRSPDGALEAFVCGTPDRLLEGEAGWVVDGEPVGQEATELWVARPDGTNARRLIRGDAALHSFREPAFSPDGQQLYFLAAQSVTSRQVCCVDLRSGERRVICSGNSLDVVQRGDYAGHLVVTQHRYFVGGGSYDWPWLFTPDGTEIGPVAMDADGEISAAFRSAYLDR